MCCDIYFYGRELYCRVLWPRAWMSSQLVTCCDVEWVDRVPKRVVILYISEMFWEQKSFSYKMVFDLKTKFSSLQMNTITVIEWKAIAKQRGIVGYYKLRKAELIHKLEVLPEVNELVLISGLEMSRNTTRSVNTSTILDQPTLNDNTPVLTLWTPSNFLPNSCRRRLNFSHTTPRRQLIFRKTSPGARRFFESEKRRDLSRAFIPLTK